MEMHKVVYSDVAKEQLDPIAMYIAQDSGDVDTALCYYDRIETGVSRLSGFPYLGTSPSDSILRLQGYRMPVVERHLVFYKVSDDEEKVYISGIFHSRMEYRFLL